MRCRAGANSVFSSDLIAGFRAIGNPIPIFSNSVTMQRRGGTKTERRLGRGRESLLGRSFRVFPRQWSRDLLAVGDLRVMSEIMYQRKINLNKKSLARSAAGSLWLEFIYYVDRMVLWICSACHAMFSNLRFSHVRE